MAAKRPTVLILGAGINGCALARELALNGLSVVVVDTADVAGGTTAYSSRLIHGGLRYLEYGEFDLVRESLAERGRLLRLAPQFVAPLELFVPVRRRWTGLWQSARRFLGRDAGVGASHDRGLWLVRIGLWLYDAYARDPHLPKHRVMPAHPTAGKSQAGPPVDPQRYRWLAAYYDAQVAFPERFALALLADAYEAAAAQGGEVRLLTYHEAQLIGRQVEIRRPGATATAIEPFVPAAIVNATGAWVDATLARLPVASPRLIGGTKGTHILTAHAELAAALAGRGIYAEAADGRPVFILPLAGMTLIGTTDEPYSGDPYRAVATPKEIGYLLGAARAVFPQIALAREDVALSYAGVRPLPFVDAKTPGAITRRHFLKRHDDAPLPLYSIVGGKLTTCRSLAEDSAATILAALAEKVQANSRERTVPGGENYPASPAAVAERQRAIAAELGMSIESVQAVWRFCGARASAVLAAAPPAERQQLLADTALPLCYVRWVIRNEWVERLDDLVERRLMLLYKERLSASCLRQLAALLVAEGRLAAEAVETEVQRTRQRLDQHFGKVVLD
jgi:glycerol-3-phosphate dehydrogenase